MTRQRLHRSPLRPYGRTLIELIIAMAISLVIIAGVSSLYLSSSGVSRLAGEAGTAEESGQIAMFVIGGAVRLAGYGEILGSDYGSQNQTLFDGAYVRGCTNSRLAVPFPATPPLLDLNCTGAGPQDALYVRFQARPEVAAISDPQRDLIELTDCLGDQTPMETIDPLSGRAGAGIPRRMVTNVFALALNAGGRLSLYCRGSGGGGNQPLVEDVVEFKVFYRLDDAAYFAGAGGATNAAPLGGSVRDAAFINGLSAAIVDPWNYVVAVMVCVSVRTNEGGVATSLPPNSTPRCPVTAVEASTGLTLTGPNPPGGVLHRTYSQVITIRSHATATPSLTL
ncbi:MAG: PilW family protein [Burkholderiaceae bacterium]